MKSDAERSAAEMLRNIGDAAPPVEEGTWAEILARVDDVDLVPANVAVRRRRALVSVAAGLLVVATGISLFVATQSTSTGNGGRVASDSNSGFGSGSDGRPGEPADRPATSADSYPELDRRVALLNACFERAGISARVRATPGVEGEMSGDAIPRSQMEEAQKCQAEAAGEPDAAQPSAEVANSASRAAQKVAKTCFSRYGYEFRIKVDPELTITPGGFATDFSEADRSSPGFQEALDACSVEMDQAYSDVINAQ